MIMAVLARGPRLLRALGVRPLSSEIHFNATDGEVEELIEQSLVGGCGWVEQPQWAVASVVLGWLPGSL